jgi:hypothetical protein
MAQEKSRAVLITPERAVRKSVFAILRVTPSKRFCMIASLTPSIRTGGSCMVIIVSAGLIVVGQAKVGG